jgi:hypothetical protein
MEAEPASSSTNTGRAGIDAAMSVVIVADRFDTIRQTVEHLRQQTISDRLELVIVTAAREQLALDAAAIAGFASTRVVEVDELLPLSLPLAAGVRCAGAPVVAMAESHAFPGGRDWAEKLVAAHREPWAAVGPIIGNANPASLASWASLFLDYGSCVEHASSGDVELLPGHNSSYKREHLLAHDASLERMLDAEVLLYWALRAEGHRLLMHPEVKVYHLNVTAPRSWLAERYYTGRRFAAVRALGWPAWRRTVYALGSPLIPLVRLPRALRDIRRSARRHDLMPRIVPLLVAGLALSAAGEAAGYAFGGGRATIRLAEMELHKAAHVNARDRLALAAWTPEAAERGAAGPMTTASAH